MRTFFQISDPNLSYLNEEPLRAELLSAEQMERFGKSLAANHKLSTNPAQDHLLKRLADNEGVLHKVRKLLIDSIKKKYQITPAGEWLIDNFYLIEEHIRNAKRHFPKDYSEDLPQLLDGSVPGLTRVYDMILQIISHSDGRIDIENLGNFVKSYQTITNLKLGELWAIPIMLRLALIENLRRVSSRIAIDRVDRNLADYWAQQLLDTAEKDSKNLILMIADMVRSQPPMTGAFVSELSRQLRGKGPDLELALKWIDQQLLEIGLASAEFVNAEIQKQAADQVSISNSISSLRVLGAMDWRDFVETHSIVDQTLREDNNGIYGSMDFATRDRYRHVVEHIAKNSESTEQEVARISIQLMHENSLDRSNGERTSHVGYYLIEQGVIETKRLAGMRESRWRQLCYLLKKGALMVYLSSIFMITLSLSAGMLFRAYSETKSIELLIFVVFLSLLSISQLAISVVNFFSTLLVKPHVLPRMDFAHEIPDDFRTFVIIPAMLTTPSETEDLVEGLEVRFLANRHANLYFGLLTDFTDAAQEKSPQDQMLLNLARHGIEALNKKYQREKSDLFFLFHRPRRWNVNENAWMGYERKRGKLSELNSLLRGQSKERFELIIGDQSILPSIKYVITLDTDTQLPLGSAWKLVGTMAHPLNHAWYDETKKRVTNGYGILQPRITVSLPETTSSFYARMHGNEPGIDPYTRASSDVYQDLFQEGSYIGKGIYEVDIFKKVLEGRFSENGILSHDLLEGCYVRSGLLSDVQLFEKYPTSYSADMKRNSRWVRGDWQILSWIFPFVPGKGRRLYKNPISGVSRWKVIDNLRRSLVPIALTTLILLGWTVLPSTMFWTITVSGIIAFPIFVTSVWDSIRKPKDVILIHHIKNSLHSITDVFTKAMFTIVCLPFEAYSNLTSIMRTLWRMWISRKKLLEWNASQGAKREILPNLISSYSYMWIEPLLALIVFALLLVYFPIKLIVAAPILLLWSLAPAITWKASERSTEQVAELNSEQTVFLHQLARKTWSFFERFVNQEDNWLPPDNFQEQPVPTIAHRTSPTNIGLSLLATLSATDFGYITNGEFIERTRKTLATMARMERYKGHFYNWYDTESLTPLTPKYISTVDSGNLAGYLFVLKQGLLAVPHKKIVFSKLFEGLQDTFSVLSNTLEEKEAGQLYQLKFELDAACHQDLKIADVKFHLEKIEETFLAIKEIDNDPDSETYLWIQTFDTHLKHINADFQIYAPWILLGGAPAKFLNQVSEIPFTTLVELSMKARAWKTEFSSKDLTENTIEEKKWLTLIQAALNESIRMGDEQIESVRILADQCSQVAEMEWDFLLDKVSKLFTIGYNVQKHQADESYYDLLASEARLCTFIGIAQGKLPEESWFALGRLLTNVNGNSILLSWSGSMFEYLMPLLVMPTYENTLLDQSCKAMVNWQIEYGRKTGLPWGISESGYNMTNVNSNYQYRAFGVPGLGLKRGLEADSVIAPYATVLALMIAPVKACENLELLREKGFEGRHGFYEAIDYTPSRLQPGQSSAIVYSFMAHHQGMSLLSLGHLLHNKPMQRLFESEPQFKAALLLLQERVPRASTFLAHTTDIAEINLASNIAETRLITTPNTQIPEVQLLSNGRYNVMVTNAGGGYSRWKDIAVTRWREDGTCDNWGTFCYICDVKEKSFWSNTFQPSAKRGEKYEVAFSQGHVSFHTINNQIEARTEIVVSPEDDIEMRRVRITNNDSVRRTIAITSYAEVVLASAVSDVMQPAFSNLFVQTEIITSQHAILCTRRPRSAEEQSPWMFHLMTLHGINPDEISYETDRMKFIGRGNTIVSPQAMSGLGPLAGSEGSVLDPIVSIRYKITLAPEDTVTIDMINGIAERKVDCLRLVDKYQDKHHKDRVFELAWTHSQVVLRQINATETDAQLFGRLASSLLFMNPLFRADPKILISNRRGQSGLWGYSVSGDLPIVLLQIEKQANMQLAKQLIKAHAYWRLKGLFVDLVIWNEEHTDYRQVLQNEIQALIPAELKDKPGGIFVRASDQISNEDRILFQTVARINISDSGGTLSNQIKRKVVAKAVIPYITPTQKRVPFLTTVSLPKELIFFNGLGGFSPDGNEYIIDIENNKRTPTPWVNVIANSNFGTVISENGSAYTWAENAHEFRLTPWSNDPVSDRSGEAFYLRDEETGHFWSTTFLPKRSQSNYVIRHGFGYSTFEHVEDGIYSQMLVYVDLEAAVKFIVIKIRNQSSRTRKLSATGYIEWVLGDNRMKSAMHMHTEIDPDSGALFAKNPYSNEFSSRVAFFDVDNPKRTFTCDRAEFIGRNGSLQNPEAMLRQRLSGRIGLALDPCAAIQVPFDLQAGEDREIIFRLGAERNLHDASKAVHQFRGNSVARDSFAKVRDYWKHTIGALRIETPDAAINMITNGWLTYQTLSSRLWGRSGYYQSGGAFGFRDQLQDVLSLLHATPQLAREQILLSASHQFREGDVQHWWHPPVGRGVRTRCSDDFLWLPFVTTGYVLHTGDAGVLDEPIHFLEGRQLNAGEESYYDLPIPSGQTVTLYEHCVQAIRHGLNFGEHGLPLMGTGDWNDGYDRVGKDGKGESVWLAFFLYDILIRFSSVADSRKDSVFADLCNRQAQQLKENIDKHAWDGQWYKRAWFDNGAPLGSSTNEECQIDSIAQSWSVLSAAGEIERTNTAMESAYKNLVQKDLRIIQLLEPPFDKTDLNPGYIKGYVPGVRENGGQYTHAAVWMIIAFAKLGDSNRVWELLSMINPINHGRTSEEVAIYKVEPYVLAADVYARAPHAGRGGWTWYTGSAGWMYRLITESFLGLQRKGATLTFSPCTPPNWESFKIHYRYIDTAYHILLIQKKGDGKMTIILDGMEQQEKTLVLIDDKVEHQVQVTLFKESIH
ncbi:MAG TPA: glucoamylase family protein [Cyclobacteriaceae bacterium]|nr:glucoamylase family protein [Cyclobacteriaceae bacterium]